MVRWDPNQSQQRRFLFDYFVASVANLPIVRLEAAAGLSGTVAGGLIVLGDTTRNVGEVNLVSV